MKHFDFETEWKILFWCWHIDSNGKKKVIQKKRYISYVKLKTSLTVNEGQIFVTDLCKQTSTACFVTGLSSMVISSFAAGVTSTLSNCVSKSWHCDIKTRNCSLKAGNLGIASPDPMLSLVLSWSCCISSWYRRSCRSFSLLEDLKRLSRSDSFIFMLLFSAFSTLMVCCKLCSVSASCQKKIT